MTEMFFMNLTRTIKEINFQWHVSRQCSFTAAMN